MPTSVSPKTNPGESPILSAEPSSFVRRIGSSEAGEASSADASTTAMVSASCCRVRRFHQQAEMHSFNRSKKGFANSLAKLERSVESAQAVTAPRHSRRPGESRPLNVTDVIKSLHAGQGYGTKPSTPKEGSAGERTKTLLGDPILPVSCREQVIPDQNRDMCSYVKGRVSTKQSLPFYEQGNEIFSHILGFLHL